MFNGFLTLIYWNLVRGRKCYMHCNNKDKCNDDKHDSDTNPSEDHGDGHGGHGDSVRTEITFSLILGLLSFLL